MSRIILHATSLSVLIGGTWRGVLVMGPSGAGKSDLALRALEAGFSLISDDYSVLWLSDERLYANAPDTIVGKLEVRGIGITAQRVRRLTRIDLCVQCQSVAPERLPDREVTPLLGVEVPTIRLDPREASTVAKLLTRLRQLS